MRHLLVVLGLLLASGPVAIVVTLALLPLWRWVEASLGIEAVGHSGPATWCYVVSYLGCALAICSLYIVAARRGRRPR